MRRENGEATDAETARLRVPWARSDRRLPRLVARPLQEFIETEAGSGILLLIAAAAALIWANAAPDSYERVWHTELTFRLGSWSISEDVRHWVNDGLMAVFFFVVGLEIKRELVSGELRDPRVAALPAAGAVGGMVVPALLYFAINGGGGGSRGWGIAMATDIAFAVGVLAVFARGLPSTLRLFLLTLAIVDDLGAIIVIAIFYSGAVSWNWLLIAAALLALVGVLRRANVRASVMYLILSIGVWLAVFESAVHATIAGVALGLITPATPFQRPRAVSDEAVRIAGETEDDPTPVDADAHYWMRLSALSREAVSPLARLENLLHPLTSFLIVPLFALANAGVFLGDGAIGDAFSSPITLGIVTGLVIGKPIGIMLGAWAGIRIGLARLPARVGWSQMLGVSAVAGIGFTVSLFIAGLAFGNGPRLASAKVGILAGSIAAGLAGIVLLARARSRSPAHDAAAEQHSAG